MGTSHRHTPGVKGEPNWGKTSSSISGIANAEEKSEKLEQNPPTNISEKRINSMHQRYSRSIMRGYHRAVRNLVRASGGRDKVSSGTSRSLGHAGISVAGAFVRAFAEIAQKGLHNWFKEKGFGDDKGKSCLQLLNLIKAYLRTDVVGMDETAANEALEYVIDNFEEKISPDASNFDEVMKSTINSSSIIEIIDDFMGIYIYSHLSQDFKEKLEHEKGQSITKSTLDDIKELILHDVRRGFKGNTASTIDWNGPEGHEFIKKEFNRIIYILSGDED